jgi:hypothetical protein
LLSSFKLFLSLTDLSLILLDDTFDSVRHVCQMVNVMQRNLSNTRKV